MLRQKKSQNTSLETYELTWIGKKQAVQLCDVPSSFIFKLFPQEGINSKLTKNIFIEGDNLHALKLLQSDYQGKIKMIYLDPPYNTGNDFIYKDNFSHSQWLSMMFPRLILAKNLLREDGIIFISIDNNEVENLKILGVEIFGEENFISELIWKSGRTSASHFTNEHEYILCFAKSKKNLPLFEYQGSEKISDRAIKKPSIKNPLSTIQFPAGIDFDSPDKIFPSVFGKREVVRVVDGQFAVKNRKLVNNVVLEAAWTMRDMIIDWINGKEVVDQKGQRILRFFFKANGVLQYEKQRQTVHPKSIIEGISSKLGSKQLVDLLGDNYFDFPKPVELIYFLAKLATKNGDIILDFFAGSSTTAHAIMKLNADDGGKRSFIMVQAADPCKSSSAAYKAGFSTIAEISKERIRQAGKKIKKETKTKQLDVGFKVLKLSQPS